MEFTQKELTAMYWLLTQLRDECEIDKKWQIDTLFTKVETMWKDAK